jgi:hypothetical protein
VLKRSYLVACILLSKPLNSIFWTRRTVLGGADAVFNARDGVCCGCLNGAWTFMPHARAMYLENKRAKAHVRQGWISSARCKWARSIGFGDGRGPSWPFETHHVDGRWCLECLGVCLCQPPPPHARHTSGFRLVNE